MKKVLLIVSSSLLLANSFLAQDTNDDFDKKFRFGLRVTAQPTWLASNDNFTSRSSVGFGYGFGLVTEFKLSNIIHFQTGIGGDFERGSVKYKNTFNETTNTGVAAFYSLDASDNLTQSKKGDNTTQANSGTNTTYLLSERKVKATYITIPLILKMMTKETSGFRYFGMFGGEIGIRGGLKADDKVQKVNYNTITPLPQTQLVTLTSQDNKGLNIGKDGSLIPMRFGFNVGAGFEYRISGSTAIFVNVNYFHSFTNTMRKESKYIENRTYDTAGNVNSTDLNQKLLMRAVRINVGIMF